MIRQGTIDDIDAYVDLNQYAYGLSEQTISRFRSRYQLTYNEHYFVEVDGSIVASARLIPFEQNIRGSWKKMGGIASVASAPDHRRDGNVRRLLIKMMADAIDDGFATCTLYPFKDVFYMKLGFVKMPPSLLFEFDPRNLMFTRCPSGYSVRMVSPDEGLAAWKNLYNGVALTFHGSVRRSDKRWTEIETTLQSRFVVVYGSDKKPAGVMIYTIRGYGEGFPWGDDGLISVHEILWNNINARNTLLFFLYNHCDQVVSIKVPITPLADDYYHWIHNIHTPMVKSSMVNMARIINIEEALDGIPIANDGHLVVGIKDSIIESNDGVYSLKGHNGYLTVEQVNEIPDVRLTIEGLSALLYGVLSPEQIQSLGWSNRSTVELLKQWFPRSTPWMTEDF